jgi:hypothetical protein
VQESAAKTLCINSEKGTQFHDLATMPCLKITRAIWKRTKYLSATVSVTRYTDVLQVLPRVSRIVKKG